MSSNVFAAELQPDPVLRRAVLISGAALALAGILLVASMPLHPLLLLAGSAGWLFLCCREIVLLARGFSRCRRLRITPEGGILLLDTAGEWHPARLLPGSVMLRRAGWVLLQTADGRRLAEPIRGTCRESHDWRRLQVIWRHIGGAR